MAGIDGSFEFSTDTPVAFDITKARLWGDLGGSATDPSVFLGSAIAAAVEASLTSSTIPQVEYPFQANTGIMIPMYIYPSDAYNNVDYNLIIDLAKKYRDVPLTVILNNANGPGGAQDGNFTAVIARLQGAGVTVLGYVDTAYGVRAIADVKTDIDTWQTFYPTVDGIFFDEMNNFSGGEAYYIELLDYGHVKGLYPIVGNPGTASPTSYFSTRTADIIFVAETSGYPPENFIKGDYFGGYMDFPYWRRGAIGYNCSFDAASLMLVAKYVGWIWITNDTLPNPYDTLPPYVERIFQALSALPKFSSSVLTDYLASQGVFVTGSYTTTGPLNLNVSYQPTGAPDYALSPGVGSFYIDVPASAVDMSTSYPISLQAFATNENTTLSSLTGGFFGVWNTADTTSTLNVTGLYGSVEQDSGTSAGLSGIQCSVFVAGGSCAEIVGMSLFAEVAGTATVSSGALGGWYVSSVDSTATIAGGLVGGRFDVSVNDVGSAGGSITGAVKAFWGTVAVPANSVVDNVYGLYLDFAGGGTISGDNWGLYQASSSQKNYFAGNVGLGITTPKFQLHQVSTITDPGPSSIVFSYNTDTTFGYDETLLSPLLVQTSFQPSADSDYATLQSAITGFMDVPVTNTHAALNSFGVVGALSNRSTQANGNGDWTQSGGLFFAVNYGDTAIISGVEGVVDQITGTSGTLSGVYGQAGLFAGVTDNLVGLTFNTFLNAGTINTSAYGLNSVNFQYSGTNSGDAFGAYIMNHIQGGTVAGNAYSLYLDFGGGGTISGNNWGLYQASTSQKNFLAGVLATTGASVVPLTIQGFASQTAHLQDWKNSFGSIVASVDAAGSFSVDSGSAIYWGGRTTMYSPGDGNLLLLNAAASGFGLLQLGGQTASEVALKRSTTNLQGRLADDSGFCFVQGKLKADNNYTATPQTCSGYITMYDATGTAYKVMVST